MSRTVYSTTATSVKQPLFMTVIITSDFIEKCFILPSLFYIAFH